MGRNGSNKKLQNPNLGVHSMMTLRQESSGKRPTSINAKSMLRLEHIRNLAVWAGGEASVPSLGAFFGQRLAALGEALGSSSDPSLFPCQRCETILQPGENCSVRIEKNTTKARRQRKRSNVPTQNSVVYKCHFCSHRNLKRGTPRGHIKTICPPNPRIRIPTASEPAIISKVLADETPSEVVVQAMPLVSKLQILLEPKRRKNKKSGVKKVDEAQSTQGLVELGNSMSATSKKRKRKTWTSLKEIAERSENPADRTAANLGCHFSCRPHFDIFV